MTPTTAASRIPQPDLASPHFKADPHPFYARLRAEAPVYRPGTGPSAPRSRPLTPPLRG